LVKGQTDRCFCPLSSVGIGLVGIRTWPVRFDSPVLNHNSALDDDLAKTPFSSTVGSLSGQIRPDLIARHRNRS
jgi:hypothetical protein